MQIDISKLDQRMCLCLVITEPLQTIYYITIITIIIAGTLGIFTNDKSRPDVIMSAV